MNRASHLRRIGERYEVEATFRIELPPVKGRFKRKPRVYDAVVRNLSVSGALVEVEVDAPIEPGEVVTVRLGDHAASMRVVRFEVLGDNGTALVALDAPPNDTQWGPLAGAFVGGPEAQAGLRWLGGLS